MHTPAVCRMLTHSSTVTPGSKADRGQHELREIPFSKALSAQTGRLLRLWKELLQKCLTNRDLYSNVNSVFKIPFSHRTTQEKLKGSGLFNDRCCNLRQLNFLLCILAFESIKLKNQLIEFSKD